MAWRDFVAGHHRAQAPSFDETTTTRSDAATAFGNSSRNSSRSSSRGSSRGSSQLPTGFLDSSWSRLASTTSPDGESTPVTLPYFQAAAKLDLARGYLDLGVKSGARELILEILRDGSSAERHEAELLLRKTYDA